MSNLNSMRGANVGRRQHTTLCMVAIVVLAAAGCRTTQPFEASRVEPVGRPYPRVPAVAPDSFPHALFDSLGLLRSPDGHSVPFVRSIVTITFKDEATQAQRQAAVDAIHGAVVGGFWRDPIGEYYIRIKGPGIDDIEKALRTLRTLSQVDFAFPLMKEPPDGRR